MGHGGAILRSGLGSELKVLLGDGALLVELMCHGGMTWKDVFLFQFLSALYLLPDRLDSFPLPDSSAMLLIPWSQPTACELSPLKPLVK